MMAQGLGVVQHAPSQPARDWFGTVDSHWPSGSRPPSSSRPRRRTESDGGQSPILHARSASNLLDWTQPSLTSRTTHNRSASNLLDGGKRQQRSAAQSQSRSQEIAELVEFLRKQEPPPESWTSQPFGDEDRGRWSRFKNMGGLVKRSKSVPKLSRQIRLPDSAVSGTTTGGHRHIAISIPMEASPFGLMPRSQYPVYHHSVANHFLDPASPVRYLNEKGVITVLRPVTENMLQSNSRGSFPGFRLSIPPSPGPPPSKALPPAGVGLARSRSSATNRDSVRLSSPKSDQAMGNSNNGVEIPTKLRNAQPLTAPPRRTSSAHGLYPPSTSNTMHRTSITRPSIDGIIATSAQVTPTPVVAKKARPISESSATEDEEPILGHAEHWPHLRQPSAQHEGMKVAGEEKGLETSGATLITENPLATMDEQETPLPTPRTAESRRDKVRKLKQRDLASLRSSPQKQGLGGNKSQETEPKASPETPTAAPSKASKKYTPKNTLSPIMVVTSIEPVEASPIKPVWHDRKRKDLEITPPGSGFVTTVEKDVFVEDGHQSNGDEPNRTKSLTIPQARRARARASFSPRTAKKSCNPTPPLSPTRTPRRANSTLDRTSLSRRREWNATRCKARRVQDVVDAVKSKMQHETQIMEDLNDAQAADRDQEFLKLYEAYREHRLRDMERRVRRLERHGDVWMRALVPVLDSLNRTMTSSKRDSRQDDPRGWKSDDEMNEDLSRGRAKHRSLPIYNLAKGNGLSSVERQAEEDTNLEDKENSPRDSDDSGLDTLEPLMRELAGAAQERLKRNEALTGIAL